MQESPLVLTTCVEASHALAKSDDVEIVSRAGDYSYHVTYVETRPELCRLFGTDEWRLSCELTINVKSSHPSRIVVKSDTILATDVKNGDDPRGRTLASKLYIVKCDRFENLCDIQFTSMEDFDVKLFRQDTENENSLATDSQSEMIPADFQMELGSMSLDSGLFCLSFIRIPAEIPPGSFCVRFSAPALEPFYLNFLVHDSMDTNSMFADFCR